MSPPAPASLHLPPRATQQALWRDAGIMRSREGLQRLLDDRHPLARLIAACALRREESRGAHQRADFPAVDPRLDHHHAVVSHGAEPRLEPWR